MGVISGTLIINLLIVFNTYSKVDDFLCNLSIGTPLLGADGNPLVMQPTYQQVMVKPGTAPVYAQPSSARAAVQSAQQSSSIAQQPQQQQQNPAQMVMPQYVGVPQPMYVMPSTARPPFAQQQAVSFPSQFQASPHVYSLSRDFNSLSFRKY